MRDRLRADERKIGFVPMDGTIGMEDRCRRRIELTARSIRKIDATWVAVEEEASIESTSVRRTMSTEDRLDAEGA